MLARPSYLVLNPPAVSIPTLVGGSPGLESEAELEGLPFMGPSREGEQTLPSGNPESCGSETCFALGGLCAF